MRHPANIAICAHIAPRNTFFTMQWQPHLDLKYFDYVNNSFKRNVCVPCVRILGIIFDQHFTMKNQVSSDIKSYHFYATSGVYGASSQKSLQNHGFAVIIARLNYGNCLLFWVAKHTLKKIKQVQTLQLVLVREHRNKSVSPLSWQIAIGYLCTFVRSLEYWHMYINLSTG